MQTACRRNLRKSGVQQAHKADRLVFTATKVWPGRYINAEGRVGQSSDADDVPERRAAILVGPEYGTISRTDLTAAAREAMEAGFDLLVAAAFNFDAHASEFDRMGALTVLQARINPDLHMPDLANTGAGNLFTVFGEPDIQVHDEADGCVSIEVAGIDMYKGGQIESSDADDIAVWFGFWAKLVSCGLTRCSLPATSASGSSTCHSVGRSWVWTSVVAVTPLR